MRRKQRRKPGSKPGPKAKAKAAPTQVQPDQAEREHSGSTAEFMKMRAAQLAKERGEG